MLSTYGLRGPFQYLTSLGPNDVRWRTSTDGRAGYMCARASDYGMIETLQQ